MDKYAIIKPLRQLFPKERLLESPAQLAAYESDRADCL